jgi:hypothetical protein
MAINPTPKEMPTGECNPTAGKAINSPNFPTSHTPDKMFQSMRVAYALRGHELQRSYPTDGPVKYWTELLGLVRHLPTLHDAALVMVQIGGRL